MDAAAAEIPEKPSGAKGVNCSMFITGSAKATKRESAAILITTNTAFTVALSRVPITSNQVTRPAIPMAGRLITPQSKGQIGRAHVCTPFTNSHLVCRLLLEKKHIYKPATHPKHAQ